MNKGVNKKKFKIYFPLTIVIILVLSGAALWYRNYIMYISTDDALIDADNIAVGSKILGRIAAVYADEGDHVTKGELLVVIDSSDLVAQKVHAEAVREQSIAGARQADSKYASDMESLKVFEINLARAKDDFERATKQSEGGVITQEQFDHIKKAYEAAAAQNDAAKALLAVSRAQINTATSAINAANTEVNVIKTQLQNTRIYSPVDGIVSKRWLLPGDITQPGQAVFTVTDEKDKWVVTYLEETKIAEVHDGQSVIITIDAFPHVKFSGKVYLLGSSTASVFSLIPPNNASGNFTKITQRVPVRISIDSVDDDRNLSSFDILPGMSAEVKILKRK
ncbi:MAG: HlyD family secretion protein [Bacteroidales bacterium]